MLYKNPRRKKEKEGEYLVYTKLQKAIVHRILDSKTYISLETNVEIDGLVRNGTTYTTDILAETKDCFYAIECVERKALSRPITMELLALSYSLWDGTKRNGKNVKSGTEKELSGLSEAEMDEQMKLCREYNRGIIQEQRLTPFQYHEGTNGDTEYEQLLPYSAMCILSFPKLDITLPVTHGTDSAALQYEAGHMHGTSLPVGGEGCHAVIAAHTGLTTAKLFDRLTDAEKGDTFSIQVLGETHWYKVDQIKIVLPENESEYLQTEDGKDYVTLYTCTPYGINDHRLLVRGIRDPEQETNEEMEGGVITQGSVSWQAAVRAAILVAIPFIVLLCGIQNIKKKGKEDES